MLYAWELSEQRLSVGTIKERWAITITACVSCYAVGAHSSCMLRDFVGSSDALQQSPPVQCSDLSTKITAAEATIVAHTSRAIHLKSHNGQASCPA